MSMSNPVFWQENIQFTQNRDFMEYIPALATDIIFAQERKLWKIMASLVFEKVFNLIVKSIAWIQQNDFFLETHTRKNRVNKNPQINIPFFTDNAHKINES